MKIQKLEEIVEDKPSELLVGRCNCSKDSTFVFIARQTYEGEDNLKKMFGEYLDYYNCIKCGTTTTGLTIKKNKGY